MGLLFGIILIIVGLSVRIYSGNRIISDVSNKNIDKVRGEIIQEAIEEMERRQKQKKEEMIREVIEELERRQEQRKEK